MRDKLSIVCLVGVFSLGLFFTFYKLSESPVTWMDEGLITQTSRNLALQGHYAIQTSPGEYVSPGFITTSYPVTFPIALSYKILGVGLLQARTVMAMYILLLFVLAYLLIRKHASGRIALLSLALLVTFAPIYGHGKNVLGEVPGLVYLLAALLIFDNPWSGLFFGLAVATKPIFLLVLPAIAVVFLIQKKRPSRIFVASLVAPILLWILVQFPHDSIGNIFSIYTNPHSTNLWLSIGDNVGRFVSEAQPIYALILLVLWLAAITLRLYRREKISSAELVAATFSVLVYLAYLRTIGYYRYFFLGEMLALMYLPISLFSLATIKFKFLHARVPPLIVGGLVLAQLFQTVTHSWVVDGYDSYRTRDLSVALSRIGAAQLVYVYNAPELINFLPSNNYMQYAKVTDTIILGESTMPTLQTGKPDIVLAHFRDSSMPLLGWYKTRVKVDDYVIMEK